MTSSGVGTLLFSRTANKNKRNRRHTSSQSSGEQHENVDDIWDDSALIEHYERSIQITYEAAKMMTQTESSSTKMDDEDVKHEKHWQIDDECYAPYLSDGHYYRAHISQIFDADKCEVTFAGYDETQTTELDDLYTVDDYENEQNSATEIDCDVTSSSSHQQQEQQMHRRNRDVTNNASKQHTGGESKAADHSVSASSKTCVEQLTSIPTPRLPCPVPPDILQRGLAGRALNQGDASSGEMQDLSAMLMSWYMCGYHTGYYQAQQDHRAGTTTASKSEKHANTQKGPHYNTDNLIYLTKK